MTDANAYKLAIVGGGPNCVYALDRIAALYHHRPTAPGIDIHIFDLGGLFGCGAVHDVGQSETSLLNRIAGQISFGANENCEDANYLLPRDRRFDFMEWLARKYEETGSGEFLIQADGWPPRYLHGLALQDAFSNYVEIIEANSTCRVFTHSAEVTDVRPDGGRYSIVFGAGQRRLGGIDEILLATGNQRHRVEYLVKKTNLETLGERDIEKVSRLYPLDENLSIEKVPPQSTVGIKGSGVSALDALLYLTEGRDGRFSRSSEGNELTYMRSGKEPGKIVIIGRSGLFPGARAHDEKSMKWPAIPTEGYYFNFDNIERLRRAHGVEGVVAGVGARQQLDFEKHVLPLAVLEMAGKYYACLMGEGAEAKLFENARDAFESFVRGDMAGSSPSSSIDRLTRPLQEIFRGFVLDIIDRGADALAEHPVLATYVAVALSEHGLKREELAESTDAVVSALRFDWEKIENPLCGRKFSDGSAYVDETLRIIDRDLWEARRGNLISPLKYACDTVWRDYRPVFTDCVDLGGLTPGSHEAFLSRYVSIHNRIADGTSLTVMEKLRALIAQNVIDIRMGPHPDVYFDSDTSQFRSVSQVDGREERFSRFVLGYLESFDPECDERPLFRNMLNSGMISRWSSRSKDGRQIFERGITLNDRLNPVSSNGTVQSQLTCIGPPVEGMRFFHHTLSRPDTVQPTIRNIVQWGNRLENSIEAASARVAS